MWKGFTPVFDSKTEQLLREYTAGRYEEIVGTSEALHGDLSVWTSHYVRDKDFAVKFLKGNSEEFTVNVERLYSAICVSENEPRDIIRTACRYGADDTAWLRLRGYSRANPGIGSSPAIGTALRFGIKSASATHRFAHRVAMGTMPGIGDPYTTLARTGGDVLAYRVRNARRYLDISAYSDYAEQQEVLIAGPYTVANVTTEAVTAKTGRSIEQTISPREHAARLGVEPVFFTSKSGQDMVQAGTHVYPADRVDDATCIRTGGLYDETRPVNIVWVDLEELPI